MALTAGIVRERAAGITPRLLHVTDVFPKPQDSPEMRGYAARGTAVHTLCENHDRGQSQVAEPQYAGYLEAWIRFLAETGAEIVENELPVGGVKFGFIGRLDRVVQIKGKLWIVDIKSGGPWPTHGPQTAAYEWAYREEKFPKRTKEFRRACVHLKRDGKYTMAKHASVHDLNTFRAYLRIAQFELDHGLRSWPAKREDE